MKRKTHKERAQPTARAHLGLLEKHSDYKKRAEDYHKKEKRLKALSSKVANRNPDEYYTKMLNSEVKDGKHRKTDKAMFESKRETLGAEAVELMKTQDVKYLRHVVHMDKMKEERLRANLHFDRNVKVGDKIKAGGKKTLFVEGGREEAERRLQSRVRREEDEGEEEEDDDDDDDEDDDDDDDDDDDTQSSKQKKAAAADDDDDDDDEYDLDLAKLQASLAAPPSAKAQAASSKSLKKIKKGAEKARLKSYRELHDREERRGKLETTLSFMEVERLMGAKGAKRRIDDGEGDGPPVFKWKRRRAK